MRSSILFCLIVCAVVRADDNWPAFRGAGRDAAVQELPLHWSPSAGQMWDCALPGYGQSSPVVWKKQAYITAVDGKNKEVCIVVAVSTTTGEIRWRKDITASQTGPNNPMMSRAASTPVVDENGVYVLFESGDVLSMSHAGDIRWQRSLSKDHGPLKNHHGLASSLTQRGDTIFALVDHTGPSYLLAMEKATGKTIWKADRKSCLSWTSPAVMRAGTRSLVVCSGGGELTGYDADTGKLVAQVAGLYSNDVPSPTIQGDLIVLAGGDNPLRPRKEATLKTNSCFKLIAAESATHFEPLWSDTKSLSYHASPLIHDDCVYIITKSGILHCRDLLTGREHYAVRLVDTSWASPIACGDLIYLFGKDGVTTVIRSGPKYEQVTSNKLWDDAEHISRKESAQHDPQNQVQLPPASPEVTKVMQSVLDDAIGDVVYAVAVTNGTFLIRTGERLICIRK